MRPFQCSFCGHDNPVNAKCCNECGSPLHLALCACGAVNEVADAKWYKCGAPVEPAPSPGSASDLECKVDGFEARLQALERDLKDLAKLEQPRARPEATFGSPSDFDPGLRSPLPPEEGSPVSGRRPAGDELRGFTGEPNGVGVPGTRLADRHPGFLVAVAVGIVLAAAGGVYLRPFRESMKPPIAANSAVPAAQAEVHETTDPGVARPSLSETPRPDGSVRSDANTPDAEITASTPPPATASEP